MKIFLLSPIYPSNVNSIGSTAVIHYFVKEWVKLGHEVHVFHLCSRFPSIYYLAAKLFKDKVTSRIGTTVYTTPPREYKEILDGAYVSHLAIKKSKPHSVISSKEFTRIVNYIVDYGKNNGMPDYFVGHWDLPQLEIMPKLKEITGKPIAIVFHNNTFNLEKTHGQNTQALLNTFDAIGFRNVTSKNNFIQKYGNPKKSFMAYSGVSETFIEAGIKNEKVLSEGKLKKFIYVGTLIKRKYPALVLEALNDVYPNGDFQLTYIGEGDERSAIENIPTNGVVNFTGRIPRNEIINFLQDADAFIMISRGELFGLVYLEAMALGCIVIGSRNEGIDGVVRDSFNGFLCEGGNIKELIETINKINSMTDTERLNIALRAKATASEFSDNNVAKLYINALS